MAFMTQAGVTLGLAQTVSAHFTWGPDFTASIVAVVVCNQIVGPPLFKRVLGPAGVGEQHHSYDPQRVRHASQIAKLGKTEVPATVRPQARGALVVAEEGNADATLVSERLRALGWEVLLADPSLSISTTTALERQTYNERSTRGLSVLPPSVREEVARFRLAAKPWEALLSARSLPTMKLRPYDRHGHVIAAAALPSPGISAAAVAAAAVGAPYTSGREHAHSDATDGGGGRPRRSSVTGAPPSPRDAAGPSPLAAGALAAGAAARRKGSGASGEPSGLGPRRTITQPPTEPVEREGRGVRRTYSFDPNGKRHLSMPTLLRSPPKPEMPENEESNPKRYADCMRLLWLASSMRSVDVVVSLLPTDDENIAICSLVNDMGPMLLALHKHQRSSPQVLLPLGDETKHAGLREPALACRRHLDAAPDLRLWRVGGGRGPPGGPPRAAPRRPRGGGCAAVGAGDGASGSIGRGLSSRVVCDAGGRAVARRWSGFRSDNQEHDGCRPPAACGRKNRLK